MNCRFLSEAVKERLEHFCDFSTEEKIEALEAILKGEEKNVFCEKRGTEIALPVLKKLDAQYEAVKFCLEPCDDQALQTLKLKVGRENIGIQHTVQFTMFQYPMFFTFVALLFDVFYGKVFTIIQSGMIALALGIMILLAIWAIRLPTEAKAKRIAYISDMIDLIQQERKAEKTPTGGSIYTVTVKKES